MKTDKTLTIHTKKVNTVIDIKIDIKDKVKIVGGDWDVHDITPIENDVVFSSIYSLIKEEKKWCDTELYKFMVTNLENGIPKWSCNTIQKCINRQKYILDLYNDIKSTGRILSREEVLKSTNLKTKRKFKLNEQIYPTNDDIHMVIDRNGKFIFAKNGCHRFSISKILNFGTVPVKIYQRHEEWEKFRNEVFDLCKKCWNGKTYQKIPHPDFDEIEPIHSDDRYDAIRKHISSNSTSLLDIGSLFGYICYRAELDGFDCTAVELDGRYLNVMKKLHDAYDMRYKIFENSIFELSEKKHDVVVAFNIFHHFLKTKNDYDKLIKFLNELEYKEMFIQFHKTDESQMVNAYKNYNEEEFARFIIENSKNKNSFECIAEFGGRKIYKIY